VVVLAKKKNRVGAPEIPIPQREAHAEIFISILRGNDTTPKIKDALKKKRSTVSQQVPNLVKYGILEESTTPPPGGMGRPIKVYSVRWDKVLKEWVRLRFEETQHISERYRSWAEGWKEGYYVMGKSIDIYNMLQANKKKDALAWVHDAKKDAKPLLNQVIRKEEFRERFIDYAINDGIKEEELDSIPHFYAPHTLCIESIIRAWGFTTMSLFRPQKGEVSELVHKIDQILLAKSYAPIFSQYDELMENYDEAGKSPEISVYFSKPFGGPGPRARP